MRLCYSPNAELSWRVAPLDSPVDSSNDTPGESFRSTKNRIGEYY